MILHFPAFVPSRETKAPEGATNFKICARLIALSDFSFDNSAKAYRQLNKEYHGRYASFDSGMLPILKMPVDPITTQLSLDQKELPDNQKLQIQNPDVFKIDQVPFVKLLMETLSYVKLRLDLEENSTKEFKFVKALCVVLQYVMVFHPVEWIVEQVHRQTDTSLRKSKLFANYLTVLILSSPLVFA